MTDKGDRRIPLFRALQFLSSLMFLFPLILNSQNTSRFTASCLNLVESNTNTLLLLQFSPGMGHVDLDGSLKIDLKVEISFREKHSNLLILQHSFHELSQPDFFSGEDPFFRKYSYNLPPGAYDVQIEIKELAKQRNSILALDYNCGGARASMSDILLLQETEGAIAQHPLVNKVISGITDHIRFEVEVIGQANEMLTARAVLYKQSQVKAAPDDRDFMRVNQYSSQIQVNEVLQLKSGRAVFSNGFPLFELEHGSYLLEIFLYKDDSLLAEKNTSFEIPWKRLKEVFFNLDASIEMMAYTSPPTRLEGLAAIEDEDEKLRKFLQFWEMRAEPGREEGTAALERYFSRIFHANEYFAEVAEGWKTDRGKIFTLYGQPEIQKSLKWNERNYEIWIFEQYSLNFVFESVDKSWKLIFPKT